MSTTPELLPLIIAVVGHRDLHADHVPVLQASVTAELQALQANAPETPLVLLSPLAEGADRLVARVALGMGLQLIVPLPKPRETYQREFADDASRREFNELIDRADQWFVVPSGGAQGDVDGDHSYEYLLAFLVKHCQILFALWDGVDSNLRGGTSEAVRFKRDGVPPEYDRNRTPLDPPDTGPVYHIYTPRESNPTRGGMPGTCTLIFPQSPSERGAVDTHMRITRHMNSFNADTRALQPDAKPSENQRSLAVLKRSERVREEDQAFREADMLAQLFQRKTNRVISWFMVLAFFALFFFEVYAYYFTDHPSIMLLYIVPVTAAYALFLVARRRDYQNKYLDYRALAEGLRVQRFWHLAGLGESVADHYLRKQRTELDWIRHAIRIWHLRVSHAEKTHRTPDARADIDSVIREWVDDQALYYSRAATRDHDRATSVQRWSNRLFICGMLIAAAHVGLQWLDSSPPLYPMLMLMSMMLILAGLLVIYSDKRGFLSQAKQFSRMTELHTAAAPRLRDALDRNDLAGALAYLIDLGKETLVENGDWVMMHRERPLEMPKLG